MTTTPAPESAEQRVARTFLRDTTDHVLAVLHDDGLYRHLRCAATGTDHAWYAWFEVVTWPGSLTIRGDMGTFTFSRDTDMLAFFRRSAYEGKPNFQYWEEKIDAADARTGVREYSEELFRQHIADDVAQLAEDDLDNRKRALADRLGRLPGLLRADQVEECEQASAAYLAGLREELDEELLGELPTWCTQDEGEALAGARQFEYQPRGTSRSEAFTFDTTEWDVREWSASYLWCCYAIMWAIAAYDRAKAEQPVPALAAAAEAGVEAVTPAVELATV